ncbi:hypothetical protein [Streptomyces europaeiscabiei]|uniref:hypothetical protein n=1 Tax=Streptomyces europaeiscabiei TaxID=146819 RepID=UPI0038F6EEE8
MAVGEGAEPAVRAQYAGHGVEDPALPPVRHDGPRQTGDDDVDRVRDECARSSALPWTTSTGLSSAYRSVSRRAKAGLSSTAISRPPGAGCRRIVPVTAPVPDPSSTTTSAR